MTRNEAVNIVIESGVLAGGPGEFVDVMIGLDLLEVDEPEADDFAYNTAVEVLGKCRRGASPDELIMALNDAGVFLAAFSDLK